MSEFISTTLGNSLIGITFLGLAVALTFLMFSNGAETDRSDTLGLVAG